MHSLLHAFILLYSCLTSYKNAYTTTMMMPENELTKYCTIITTYVCINFTEQKNRQKQMKKIKQLMDGCRFVVCVTYTIDLNKMK